ncbi:MAG TPA: hypothetical protein PLQ27_01910 [Candidatus Paceibacterota bacterium]|jgi:hypothetical protein|nr:hypothetical protein [Candidatus Paceibacterota bacterium]HOQ15560.1 hypothetical protein [Candidatus Paceibacterota bacterium]
MNKKNILFVNLLLLAFLSCPLLGTILLADDSGTTTTSTTSATSTTTSSTTTTVSTTTTTIPKPIRPIKEGINLNELKQSLTIEEVRGWRLGVVSQINSTTTIPTKDSTTAYIKAGVVTEVGDKYLKVNVFDYIFEVDLSSAKLMKQSWAVSELDNYSVGDIVNVYGYLDNENNALIHAINVRDLSLTNAQVSYQGTIKTINSADKSFVLTTRNNQEINVKVSNETRIIKFVRHFEPDNQVKSRGTYIEGSFSDLIVGEPVIVRGLWSNSQSLLQAQTIAIGNDERPFFKAMNQTKTNEEFQNQKEQIQNEIKNRIQQLQDYINDIVKQIKARQQGNENKGNN